MATESANAGTTEAQVETTEAGSEKIIDDTCVVGGDPTSGIAVPIVIEQPSNGEVLEVLLAPGQKYFFDFAEGDVQSFVQQGDTLTLTFADNSALVLKNFGAASTASTPATLAFSNELTIDELAGRMIEVVETVPEDTELEEPQSEIQQVAEVPADTQAEQVAKVEPAAGDEMAELAEALAEIETAAGDDGAGAAGGNTGFGFNSSFNPQGVAGLEDVGPIDPTLLQYGVDVPTEELLFQPQGPSGAAPNSIPVVGDVVVDLDETNLAPTLQQSGTIPVDFGVDSPGLVAADGTYNVSGSLLGGTFTSGGELITITATPTGYTGKTPAGDTVFTFTVNNLGEYEFEQFLPIDHNDATDPNDVISLQFGIIVEDSNGDVDFGTVTINVADDAPADAAPDSNTFDESALAGGDVVINDTLIIDFGNDVEGTVTPTGTPASVTGVTTLTSGGDVITITATAGGYVGTLPGGATAFELVINPATGGYTYTQKVPLDHNPVNDTISIQFPVTVTDFDGDTTATTITVNINDSVPEFKNDTPKLGDGLEIVDETDLPGVSESGKLTVDFGADVPGAVTPTGAGSFTFGGSALGGNLTSGGDTVEVTLVGNQYIGTTAVGGDTIFTLTIETDGSYTFNLLGTLDHADPNDPNDIIDLTFGATVTDGDGDTDSTTILIKVKDDVPTIGDAKGDVDETNLDVGPISTSDTLITNFGTEVGTISPDGNVVAKVGGVPIALTAGLEPVTFVQTADGYEGTTPTQGTIFTLTVDQTGKYVYTQVAPFDHPDGTDPNDTIELEFGVAVTSTDGDSDTGTITVSVADDGVVANDDFNGAEEGQSITGSVTANDDFSQDVDNNVTEVEFGGATYSIVPGIPAVITTPLGTLTLSYDGSYTFEAVNTGDPDGTLVFTYTLTDGDTDNDTAKLSIKVTPDGAPVAVSDAMTVDETNINPGPLVINETLNVDFGLDGQGSITPNGSVTPSGSLAGGNLTSGGETVNVTATADGYVGTTTSGEEIFVLIIQDNGDYSFELKGTLDHADSTDPNDLIKIDFGITVKDSDGDAAEGVLTINILDDAPVAFDDGNTVLQNTTTVNGNVTDNDIAGEDSPSVVTSITFGANTVAVVPGVATSINGDHGTLNINADGTYQYVSNGGNANVETDEFTYGYTDFDGDTDTAELTITIKDVDDKPELAAPKPLQTDDTDLVPTDSDSNQLTADFGNDGPGTFEVAGIGTFNFAGATNNALTSNDVPVNVTIVGNDYVGTAGGTEVFRLTLNAETGEYEFTQSAPLDHADTTNPDDAITLNFGVIAKDADGDTDPGTITVTVKDDGPVAHDDFNSYDTNAGVANGNVITGLNGGAGAADDLSKDDAPAESADHDVVQIIHNGTVVDVPAGGSASINGDYGVLTIQDDGSYSYVLNAGVTAPNGGADTLDPNSGDVAGNAAAFTKNGITVTSTTGTDLTWWNGTGPGVGVGHDQKVWPNPDGLNVDFALAEKVTFEIGDIGSNNLTSDLRFDIKFQDGTTETVIFDIATTTPVNGVVTVSFDSADFGGKMIDSVGLPYHQSSFVLHDVHVEYPGEDCIMDTFQYVLQDGDGDQSTATLELCGKDLVDDTPIVANPGIVAVDETDMNPQDEVSGQIVADFGGDDPGTFTATGDGSFQLVSGAKDGALTSNGDAVSVKVEGNDYVGRTADNTEVFRLDLNKETGEYEFILSQPLDHADATDANDVINLTFGVTVQDSDDDTAPVTVRVRVFDDGPSISSHAGGVAEPTDFSTPLVVDGTLDHSYGEDGKGEINPNGNFMAKDTVGGPVINLTSNGSPITVTETADGYVGKLANGTTVLEFTINNDGQYSYKQFANIDHPPGKEVLWLQFFVEINDFDGDTDTGFVMIDLVDGDDKPTATAKILSVDETDMDPRDEDSNFINANFGDDAPGSFEPTDASDFQVVNGAKDGTLTSNGVPVNVDIEGNDYVGRAGGDEVFRLSINETTGEYEFILSQPLDHADATNANDVINLNFGVKAIDSDGDEAPVTVKVRVFDDGPQISSFAGGISEPTDFSTPLVVDGTLAHSYGEDGKGEINPNGNFMAKDTVGGPVINLTSNGSPITVTETADGYVGKLANGTTVLEFTINNDGQYTYTQYADIDHGDKDILWLQFFVEINDFDGDTATGFVMIDLVDGTPEVHVDVEVNNGVDDICVKEDGEVDVPVTANYTGGDGDEVMTLTLTGVDPAWDVTATGWTNLGGGTYQLTLPAGQHDYTGSFTFAPPANSDVDLTGLNVRASVYDPDTAQTETSDDGFKITTDAVVDAFSFDAGVTGHEWSAAKTFVMTQWSKYGGNGGTEDWVSHSKIKIEDLTHPDADGSESLKKIVFTLPDAIDNVTSLSVKNPNGTYTEVSGKVTNASGTTYTIDLSGMTYEDAVDFIKSDLYLTYQGPSNLDGIRNVGVTIHSFEKNLSGGEWDYSDNNTSYSTTIPVWYCISPLVIDMDGDGIELLSLMEGVAFDMTNDGILDQTGWVKGDDALLALDVNNDGIINDQSELFGNNADTNSGFGNLAQYDVNADGVIDANDDIFGSLVVWQDLNADGVSQLNEMLSMDQAGLIKIDLGAIYVDQANQISEGNLVTETSSVTRADGTTTQIADVWFDYNDGLGTEYGTSLVGGEGDDVLVGSAGADTLYGGSGADIFLFETTQDFGMDTIKDFNASEGDVIDISSLLQSYDPLQDSINEFVFATEVDGNTVVSVDVDGAAGNAQAVDLVILEGVTGFDLDLSVNVDGKV